jgi:hypothetical protein
MLVERVISRPTLRDVINALRTTRSTLHGDTAPWLQLPFSVAAGVDPGIVQHSRGQVSHSERHGFRNSSASPRPPSYRLTHTPSAPQALIILPRARWPRKEQRAKMNRDFSVDNGVRCTQPGALPQAKSEGGAYSAKIRSRQVTFTNILCTTGTKSI